MSIISRSDGTRDPEVASAAHQIEVTSLFHSTDVRLKAAAMAIRSRCLSHQENRLRVLITTPHGGGAPEIGRCLAIQAARSRRSWLAFPKALDQQNFNDADVLFGPINMFARYLATNFGPNIISFYNGELTDGRLKEFLRLGFLVLEIPAICRRPGDIMYIAQLVQRQSFPPGVQISDAGWKLIRDYSWPGDIAHLRMVLELAGQLAFLNGWKKISDTELFAIIDKKEGNLGPLCVADQYGWGVFLKSADVLNLANFCGYGRVRKALECWVLAGARAAFSGDTAAAARSLQVPYTTLVSRIKTLGMRAMQF